MSDQKLNEIVVILKEFTNPKKRGVCKQFITVVMASIGFVISLQMNEAMKASVESITGEKTTVAAYWISALIIFAIGFLAIWLLLKIKCK